MKKQMFFYTICIVILALGCAQKAIPLKPTTSNSYLVLQLDRADLYFTKEAILNATMRAIRDKSNPAYNNELLNAYEIVSISKFDTLSFPLQLDNSIIDSVRINAHLLTYLNFYELLKNGELKVYDKASNQFVEKVYYKNHKTQLGQRGEAYYFPNGSQFYYHVLVLGE